MLREREVREPRIASFSFGLSSSARRGAVVVNVRVVCLMSRWRRHDLQVKGRSALDEYGDAIVDR